MFILAEKKKCVININGWYPPLLLTGSQLFQGKIPNRLCLFNKWICVYLINISQLAMNVLAEMKKQVYRTLGENLQVEEEREKPLGERWVLWMRQIKRPQTTHCCAWHEHTDEVNCRLPNVVSLHIFIVHVVIWTNCRRRGDTYWYWSATEFVSRLWVWVHKPAGRKASVGGRVRSRCWPAAEPLCCWIRPRFHLVEWTAPSVDQQSRMD